MYDNDIQITIAAEAEAGAGWDRRAQRAVYPDLDLWYIQVYLSLSFVSPDLGLTALASKLCPALHLDRLVRLRHHGTVTRWLFY